MRGGVGGGVIPHIVLRTPESFNLQHCTWIIFSAYKFLYYCLLHAI